MINEKLSREVLLSCYSDVFKDLNGFRPRGPLFPSHLSREELEAELAKLEDELARTLDEEQEEDGEPDLFDLFYGEDRLD